MPPRTITPDLSVSPQLALDDLTAAAEAGFRTVISNRPNGEAPGQPTSDAMREHARAAGLDYVHIPIVPGQIGDADVRAFGDVLEAAKGPVLAFCRTGTRSASLWALSQAGKQPSDAILAATAKAGYDLGTLEPRLAKLEAALKYGDSAGGSTVFARHDVVIVGGGSAGIATAASLRSRNAALDIAVIEPSGEHYYQPGWTMIGAGIFDPKSTCRTEASVIPKGVKWIRAAVRRFRPENNEVELDDGKTIGYRALVVAPGIMLDWDAINGLTETLGRNGVTSNYRFDIASYTWALVQQLKEGVALFTQPPMPIKCAGAPQKAMYLSCDYWRRQGRLGAIEPAFHNAGAVLFGVKNYVPPLMRYIEGYGIDLQFDSKLVSVDGPARRATFSGKAGEVTRDFNMLHVCPPHKAPAFLKDSPLANAAGYVEVDETTLRHVRYDNVFGLGDAASPSQRQDGRRSPAAGARCGCEPAGRLGRQGAARGL